MIRTSLRVIRHCISTTRIDRTVKQLQGDLKIDFYPVVGIRERKLGACIFNQPANQNLLTEEFADELYRFLLSYQYDNTVQNIWIQSKDHVFCHGVDYKRLSEDKAYLDKLSKLAILVARFNKPIFGQIAGGAKGAGAYLLSMMNMPLGYRNTFLKLDQCSRGLTPLMGGTHRLARLPLHLGYYLALTGDELNYEEMSQLGFLKGTIFDGVTNSQIRKKFHEANLYFRQKFRYTDFDDPKSLLEAEQKQKILQNKERYQSQLKYFQSELLANSPRNLSVRFAANQHLAATVDYQNATNPHNSFSESESTRTINNYFDMRLRRPLEYLKEHKLVSEFEIKGVELKRVDVSRIDYIFGKETLAEVIQALKQEGTPWAQRAYNRINKADPLAVALTFQLLKRAEKQPWIACVETEFAVARKLIKMSTLELRTFKNSSHYVFVNKYSETDVSTIPQKIIKSFFTQPQGDLKFQHDVVPYSLLPVNDYYQDLPDSVRTYLNRQPFVDKHYSEQVPEITRFLNREKINYRSKVYDVDILRRKVYERLEIQKQKERIRQRLGYLAAHDQDLTRYLDAREKYLQSVDDASLQRVITAEVHKIFKKKFQKRFSAFQQKTASMIGFQKRIELFKKVKDIILKNLLYNGYAYEQARKSQAEYNGLIYFDGKGRDIYNSKNPYLQSDQALKQLAEDVQKGNGISEQFSQYENEVMPRLYGTPEVQMDFEKHDHEMWAKIKERYDDKPELWAQAYTYKELIIQASKTSQELASYLDWTFENFYDLLNYTQKLNDSYGQFAIDMTTEVSKAREAKISKLQQVEKERKAVLEKGLFSKLYNFKEENKMREIFPYYFKDSQVPGQFRRSFLSTLDSTLKEFTSIYGARSKHDLLAKQQLGVLDKWINNDLASEYTEFLKHDVEYVTSYIQILVVKEMLTDLYELDSYDRGIQQAGEYFLEKFNVDFSYNGASFSMQSASKSITQFLYFLVDMHTRAKAHIKSPQSKLLDFINRLKTHYEFTDEYSLPYSFEGLMLMIGKDRKKIYDRYLGNTYIAEPEFLMDYVNRQTKKTVPDFMAANPDHYPEQVDQALQDHFNMNYSQKKQTKRLIQNYFYYMMEFERYIHLVCGKESFIPEHYVSEEHKKYNQYGKNVISSQDNKQWFKNEVKAVIDQLLAERYETQKKLTKGELYLYDQEFAKKLQPYNIKKLVKGKLTEEIFLVKNLFSDRRDYEFLATEPEEADLEYTKVKRTIKNREALKKLNNLNISQQIYIEYMGEKEQQDEADLLPQQRMFAQKERQYYKSQSSTRLPFKSYHRMARDVFVYPEDMISVPSTEREIDLFKKININFERSLAGEKINLSRFTSQYKQLSKQLTSEVLNEMVDKINRVQNL